MWFRENPFFNPHLALKVAKLSLWSKKMRIVPKPVKKTILWFLFIVKWSIFYSKYIETSKHFHQNNWPIMGKINCQKICAIFWNIWKQNFLYFRCFFCCWDMVDFVLKILEKLPKFQKWPNYWILLQLNSWLDQNAFQKVLRIWKKVSPNKTSNIFSEHFLTTFFQQDFYFLEFIFA